MEKRCYGTDPEFFIYKDLVKTEYGEIPSVIPPASLFADMGVNFTLSPNGKRVLLENDNYRVIEDGAALEFNFKSPFTETSQVNYAYQLAKGDTNRYLRNIDKSLNLASSVLGFFDLNLYAKGRDKSFLDAIRFGCDADVFPNLYLIMGFEQDVCKIIDASKHEYRYSGGHVHIQNMSNNPDIYSDNLEYASIVLDFILGTINVMITRTASIKTQELARLKYYGRPGRVRLQKYTENINGIEYRPPSNQWITDNYASYVILKAANIAGNIVESGLAQEFYLDFKDRIVEMWDALTTHNKDLANTLLLNSFKWSLEHNVATFKEIEDIYGNIR